MILFNKIMMHDDVFPFPPLLTSLHMLGSLGMSLVLLSVAPGLFPSYKTIFKGQGKGEDTEGDFTMGPQGLVNALSPFVPIAACFTASLVTANSAYEYAAVSFLQMVKESQIGIIFALSVVFGVDKFTWPSA